MRPTVLFLATAAVLCLSACPHHGLAPTKWGPGVAAPDPGTMSLLRAAGDRATVVLLLHPGRWPEVARTLRAYLEPLPFSSPALTRVLSTPDVYTAVIEGVYALERPPFEIPRTLPGWDPGRPLVAALFEPQVTEATLAARAALPGSDRGPLPGVRHRVLIPATDPQTLLSTLTDLLERSGFRSDRAAAGFPGLRGGKLHPLPGGEGFVAFIPGIDHVRIEIVTDERPAWPGLHRDLQAGRLTPEAVREQQFAGWHRLLGEDPAVDELLPTPALHHLASARAFLIAYLRPWQLRDLAGQVNTRLIRDVLSHADLFHRAQMIALGIAEVSNGYLLMTPEGAEMDDLALSLTLEDSVRVTEVASLTELGASVYAAGVRGASSPFGPSDIPTLATFSLGVDFSALLDKAALPPGVLDADVLYKAVEPFRECGTFCFYHAMARNPMGILKMLRSFASFEVVGHLPRSLQGALVSLEPENPQAPFRAAVAATMPKGYNTRWLRRGLAELDKPQHSGGILKTQLYVEPGDDHDTVLLGFHIDPREVFSPSGPRPRKTAPLAFDLDIPALVRRISDRTPAVPAYLLTLGRLRGRGWHAGRALVGEMTLGLKGAPEPKAGRLPIYTNMDWPSPGLAKAQSKGAGCLAHFTRGMIQAFRALAGAEPAMRTMFLVAAVEELEPDLDCAGKDPVTREEAKQIHRAVVRSLDAMLTRDYEREKRIELLSRACSKGIQEACKSEEMVRAVPGIELAQVERVCGDLPSEGVDRILVPAGETAATEARARPVAPVDVAVDGRAEFGKASQALQKLAAAGVREVEIPLQNERGGVLALRARLPEIWEPLRAVPDAKDLHLAVLVDGNRATVAGPGGRIDIPARDERVDTAELETTLKQTREAFSDAVYHFDATGKTAWKDAAAALAVLACGKRPVTLGPAPVYPQGDRSAAEDIQDLTPTPEEPLMVGPMTRSEIVAVIRKHRNKVKHCYEKQLVKNPELEGKVFVDFTIGPDGKVLKASLGKNTTGDEALGKCVIEAIRTFRFNRVRGGGIVRISYPFIFKPGG